MRTNVDNSCEHCLVCHTQFCVKQRQSLLSLAWTAEKLDGLPDFLADNRVEANNTFAELQVSGLHPLAPMILFQNSSKTVIPWTAVEGKYTRWQNIQGCIWSVQLSAGHILLYKSGLFYS